jgi:hypothetical protein
MLACQWEPREERGGRREEGGGRREEEEDPCSSGGRREAEEDSYEATGRWPKAKIRITNPKPSPESESLDP